MCGKMANNYNNMVKGFQETAECLGYAESLQFLPAQGLFIFKKKSIAATSGKLDLVR